MAGKRFQRTTFSQLISDGALEIGDGYRAKNDELGGSGLIFLRAGHVTDTHIDFEGVDRFHAYLESRVRSKLAKTGDTVITTKGNSTGRTTFVLSSMPPFVYSPHLSYWRSLDSTCIESGFLRYWSKSPEFTEQLAGMKTSTDMAPYLSLVDQKRLQITLPPVSEQRAIAHILGTLDDKIELNRRTNETLEAIARAIFQSWFVDFDPVRAKASGEPTDSICRRLGLTPDLLALFPDSFQESELGEIPKGWEVSCLGDFAKINYGANLPAHAMLEKGVPVYGAAGIVGYYSEAMFSAPVILVTSRGSGSGTVHETDGPAFVTNNSFTVVPIEKWFSRHLLRWSLLNADITSFVTGSAQPQLTITNFERLKLLVSTKAIVIAFHMITDPLWTRATANRVESRTLAALRDTLLPKLLSGELRVKGAEKMVEAAW